jgi:predicted amidophosphoribosyltransferase
MPAPPALAVPAGLDSCRALLAYDAEVRRVVVGLKNRDQRALVTQLARSLAALVPEVPGLVVTWAPTSAARRRDRGFDQAELLARAVARRVGRPVTGLLSRRPGPPQSGRDARARQANPVFAVRRRCVEPVLLVDDVATTGATLTAAAAALRAGGAPAVHGLVVARAAGPRAEYPR